MVLGRGVSQMTPELGLRGLVVTLVAVSLEVANERDVDDFPPTAISGALGESRR